MELLETIVEKLKEFRSVARDLISNACHRALLDQGFTTDDSSFYAQFIGKISCSLSHRSLKNYVVRIQIEIGKERFIIISII